MLKKYSINAAHNTEADWQRLQLNTTEPWLTVSSTVSGYNYTYPGGIYHYTLHTTDCLWTFSCQTWNQTADVQYLNIGPFSFLNREKKKCQVIFWKIIVCCCDDKYHLHYRAVRVQEQGLLATCSFLFACCIGWLTAQHKIGGESQSCYVYMYIAHGQCFVNKGFRNVYTSLYMKFAWTFFLFHFVSVKFCVRRTTRCMFKGLYSTFSKM